MIDDILNFILIHTNKIKDEINANKQNIPTFKMFLILLN